MIKKGHIGMKKFHIFKTIQLILFIALAGIGLYIILTDSRLYQLVANDMQVRTLCILLWLAFGLSFLCIFTDFSLLSSFKRDYRELDYAVSSDPVAGIANRYSCDTFIEKYLDKPLPAHIGCVMLNLSNLAETNLLSGHTGGNNLIRDFSSILQSSSMGLCFVGRNGGNNFLALFENCTHENIDSFLRRVALKTDRYNHKDDFHQIQYRYGIAFEEGPQIATITDLIALSNRRIFDENAN